VSYVLAFFGFAALILLHEAGHFAAAKAVGMRVERFSLFFGPLLVKVRRGETDYGIAPIPLGGYVKITGMNPRERLAEQDEVDELNRTLDQVRADAEVAEPGDVRHAEELTAARTRLTSQIAGAKAKLAMVRKRAYYNQPVWKRIVVILAGPAVNLVIAFTIVFAINLSQGQQVPSNRVAQVVKGTPAAKSLLVGDRIVSVDGVTHPLDAVVRQIRSHRCAGTPTNGCLASAPARVIVRRHGRLVALELRPHYVRSAGYMQLGFDFGFGSAPISVAKAASLTVSGLWSVTEKTVSRFATLFEPQSRKDVHSVVGAYKVTQEYFSTSTTLALELLALISLSLAIINLFPFLPLDGGHVFWALVEKVRGRRVPVEVMERASAVGFALILLIFTIGLSNDISTLSGRGFGLR
jgi:regulator of sigma E protease